MVGSKHFIQNTSTSHSCYKSTSTKKTSKKRPTAHEKVFTYASRFVASLSSEIKKTGKYVICSNAWSKYGSQERLEITWKRENPSASASASASGIPSAIQVAFISHNTKYPLTDIQRKKLTKMCEEDGTEVPKSLKKISRTKTASKNTDSQCIWGEMSSLNCNLTMEANKRHPKSKLLMQRKKHDLSFMANILRFTPEGTTQTKFYTLTEIRKESETT